VIHEITIVYELINLGRVEKRSADGQDVVVAIQELHTQVKQQLQNNNDSYKHRPNLKKREVSFEIGDLVLAHLRK